MTANYSAFVEQSALGAPEPQMLPFDPSKYELMPEVEINPHDEFYAEENDDANDEG